MTKPLLICDLDGTLVDSYPGIAEALRQACEAVGVTPRQPLDRSIVGPPLDELLRWVTGCGEAEVIGHLRATFIEAYDNGASRLTIPFPGVVDMLHALVKSGVELALATNKRQKPTKLILEALGWRDLFHAVETVDSRPSATRSKSRMLLDILDLSSPAVSAYIGDTNADVDAAQAAGLPCLLAGWSHSCCLPGLPATIVLRPEEVPSAFVHAAAWHKTVARPGISSHAAMGRTDSA